jgi:OPA family glycerol-3-phosphate transporter-like MFS transporter
MNLVMGLSALSLLHEGPLHGFLAANFLAVFSVLYAVNMYFQSFGAVAIVKVNAPWFHVRERGVFGAIFGILISLGIYFAFDIGYMILDGLGLAWVFLMPALLLGVFWIIDWFVVRNRPSQAGFADFATGDATSGDDGPRLGAGRVFRMMLTNPIIMTIAGVEFCSGFLRQAIMQWYNSFAKQTDAALGLKSSFVNENWGLLLCIAGISGGVCAGFISDHVFQSRRGPVAGLLYGIMLVGAVVLTFTYTTPLVGWLVIVMSMAVIGVHGMLSGTASMDFGGARNAGIAVGIIDGFVYLGTGVMSLTYAIVLPKVQLDEAGHIVGAATDPANWRAWPLAMIPAAVLGLALAARLWHAKPKPKSKPEAEPAA